MLPRLVCRGPPAVQPRRASCSPQSRTTTCPHPPRVTISLLPACHHLSPPGVSPSFSFPVCHHLSPPGVSPSLSSRRVTISLVLSVSLREQAVTAFHSQVNNSVLIPLALTTPSAQYSSIVVSPLLYYCHEQLGDTRKSGPIFSGLRSAIFFSSKKSFSSCLMMPPDKRGATAKPFLSVSETSLLNK